jgi:hypothetical protein
LFTSVGTTQVEHEVVGSRDDLVPLLHGLDVDRSDLRSARCEIAREVTSDEPTCACYHDQSARHQASRIEGLGSL